MEKPLILLVYPENPDTYWSYKHALSFVGKRAVMPPLGLATIAAMIPDQYEIRIVDLNVERLSERLLRKATLVLLSAMIVQAASLQRVIRASRAAGTPVAVGGPYATSSPEALSGADYLVLGEAEEIFPRFLADFTAGTARRIYRCDSRPELSLTPAPRFDLLRLDYYNTIPVQFSRGCPFDCEFCDIVQLFGHRARTKDPGQFLAELAAVRATGYRGAIFVVDDNFIGNRRAVKNLLRALVEWQDAHGRPFTFSTEASIDLARDEELLDLMVHAGFNMVFVGIESPEPESLVAAHKLQNLREDITVSVRRIQERGMEVTGGFIIGFDTDTEDIFDLQIEFIRKLAIPTAMVGLLMALPNTKLHERLIREGRMTTAATGNNSHSSSLNFVPRLPRKVLEDGFHRVLATIYSPRIYFERCLEVLRRYPAGFRSRQFRRRISYRELLGFVSSLVRQTISSYGIAYLRYMLKALGRRPDLAVAAITMAVQGHHYVTITNLMLRRYRLAARKEADSRQEQPTTAGEGRGIIEQLVPSPRPAN